MSQPDAAATSITFTAAGTYRVRVVVSSGEFHSTCDSGMCVEATPPPGNSFLMANCNGDTAIDISDGVALLAYLFTGGAEPPCLAACNPNADAITDISDAVFVLSFLFTGGPPPDAPYPSCDSRTAAECAQTTCAALP